MAARRFLPTIIVYVCLHLAFQLPISVNQFLLVPVFALFFIFALGFAAFFATLQIYFRDTRTILPYIMRIWLYVTPVLYFSSQISENLSLVSKLNPLYDLFVLWGEILIKGVVPGPEIWIGAVLWTFFAFIGGISFFLSREREFAIRV
jgi:teichoic acid transport system permease protein